MKRTFLYYLSLFTFIFGVQSCKNTLEKTEYKAFFGGEVLFPQNDFVLFMKNNKVVDTLFLDKKNRFFKEFDSLTPGLYTFKHHPEYQYVYFDKNDSLMVTINTRDFDNSIVFCGRGDEKNNFLMEMYLANEKDKAKMYDVFYEDALIFLQIIEKDYQKRKLLYQNKKNKIRWDATFDTLALASLNLPYFTKKEIYPYAHQYLKGLNEQTKLPNAYYSFRKKIDFNNDLVSEYSPFINYVTSLLNNVAYENQSFCGEENILEANIQKLIIADTLIKKEQVKNKVLNSLAFKYLIEDQNMYNNERFIKKYLEFSTDKEMHKEIKSISKAVQSLSIGNPLPKQHFIDRNNETVDLNLLVKNQQTVLYFWTTNANSHIDAVHRKVEFYKSKYPKTNFVGINIDDTQENWQKYLSNLRTTSTEIHAMDFESIKKQWVINKIHRVIVLHPDGTIKNGFANMFDVHFHKNIE